MDFKINKLVPALTKPLLIRAAPCMLEQLFLVFVNMINILLVSNISREVLTAASMSNQLMAFLQVSFTGLCTGATVVIGRLWGSGERQDVKVATAQAFNIISIVVVVLLILLYSLKTQIINLFFGHAESLVWENIDTYLSIVFLGIPAMALITLMNASYRGIGDNKSPLYITICLNIVSLVLSLALIYGIPNLGIPKMGIAGAALGITLARFISALFGILRIFITKSVIAPKLSDFKWIDREMVSRVVHVAFPSFIEQSVFQGGFLITQTLLLGFGTVFQSGYQISTTLKGITDSIGLALAVAQVALISQSLGGHGFRRAEEYIKAGNFLIVVIFVPLSILMFIFAPQLAQFYSRNDPEVLNSTVTFIKIWSALTLVIAYTQMTAGVLRGAGDMKYVAVSGIVGLWATRIFGIWFLSIILNDGYLVFIISLSLDFVTRDIIYYLRLKKGNWKYIKV